MDLAIFDLDNTLISGDSDYLWGEFMVEQGLVNATTYREQNKRFFDQYQAGNLDIDKFLEFSLKPLTQIDIDTLEDLHKRYMAEKIEPIILPAASRLLNHHRGKGNHLLIITATNRFVTEPIAKRLGVDDLLATEPELINRRYTGQIKGSPCYQQGKVENLRNWVTQTRISFDASWFYSDSHNDIPLLEEVEHPVAVDPDQTLHQHAKRKNWEIISLRD